MFSIRWANGVAARVATACGLGILVISGCGEKADLGPVANAGVADVMREKAFLTTAEPGSEGAEAASTGTGWATIKGQFTYDGDPAAITLPELTAALTHDDRAICAPGGKAPKADTLIVDSGTKGIKNIAVYVRSPKRVHESAQATTDPVVFDQQHCMFLTRLLGVTVGQPVELKNSDATGHNTKIGGSNSFNQTIPGNQAITFTAQKEDAIPAPVACSIHPWMSAYILPRKDRYFAITDDQGNFEIANVPAGEEIELQVWHERGAGGSNGLVGNPNDASLKWDKRGRVKLTLQPDEVKEVKVAVPASAFKG